MKSWVLSWASIWIGSAAVAQTAPPRYAIVQAPSAEQDCRNRAEIVVGAVTHASFSGMGVLTPDGRRLKYVTAEHNLTCALDTGAVRYWNTLHHGAALVLGGSAPAQSEVQAVVDGLLASLDTAGLVFGSELDRTHVHVSHQMAGGGAPGQPKTGPFILDTRVGYRRLLGGVPVVNNGIEIVVDNALVISSVYFQWRPVDYLSQTATKLTAGMNDALAGLKADQGSFWPNLSVLQQEVSYVDSGAGSQQYYEPWYVILYQVTVPDASGGEMPGKREIWQYPMIDQILQPIRLANAPGGK